MTKQENDFITKIGDAAKKYYNRYGILPSLTIAQAILESGWGRSMLAWKYHNYFGMKAGNSFAGAKVKLQTKEEYVKGQVITTYDYFRAYPSLDAGIKGRFEFLQMKRYQNLKGIIDYKQLCQTIKDDGYATDSTYVTKLCNLIIKYDLWQYDIAVITPSKVCRTSCTNAVRWLQDQLNKIDVELPKLVIDGIYGEKTRAYLLAVWSLWGWNKKGKSTGWCSGEKTINRLKRM